MRANVKELNYLKRNFIMSGFYLDFLPTDEFSDLLGKLPEFFKVDQPIWQSVEQNFKAC